MALNTSIPLGVQPTPFADPVRPLASMLALRQEAADQNDRQAARDRADADRRRQANVEGTLQKFVDPTTGRLDEEGAARELMKFDVTAGVQMWRSFDDKKKAELAKERQDLRDASTLLGNVLQAPPDQRQAAYSAALSTAIANKLITPEMVSSGKVPAAYDEATVTALYQSTMTRAEQIDYVANQVEAELKRQAAADARAKAEADKADKDADNKREDARLQETIRSNQATEGIARTRAAREGKAADEDPYHADDFKEYQEYAKQWENKQRERPAAVDPNTGRPMTDNRGAAIQVPYTPAETFDQWRARVKKRGMAAGQSRTPRGDASRDRVTGKTRPAAPATAGQVSRNGLLVTAPDGSVHRFPNEDAAKRFEAAAKAAAQQQAGS